MTLSLHAPYPQPDMSQVTSSGAAITAQHTHVCQVPADCEAAQTRPRAEGQGGVVSAGLGVLLCELSCPCERQENSYSSKQLLLPRKI
jgi:hypothetical protein